MKIAMLTTKYSASPNSPYLTDELARELAAQGHEVTVFLADWANEHIAAPATPGPSTGPTLVIARAVVLPWLATPLRRAVKWLVSPARLAFRIWKNSRTLKPDVVVAFSPLMALHLPVWMLTRTLATRRFLVQWDFFPDSHVQNHALHGALKIRLLRAAETYLMRRFDVIGCMSARNIDYLRRHCDVRPSTPAVHLPLWTSRPAFTRKPREVVRRQYGLPLDTSIFVFGGQFIPGRGIEDILQATQQLDRSRDKMLFLFIGSGPLATQIEADIQAGNPFIKLMSGVPRSEYLSLISACNVGVVSTVRDVTVPTFPSKTLDYLLAGLPVLASVEESTDFGEFVEAQGIGVRVLAGEITGFVAAARTLGEWVERDGEALATRCSNCLDQHFSVASAARIVVAQTH
jgi:glycosyltransferase involved in cell wall biosynthesis